MMVGNKKKMNKVLLFFIFRARAASPFFFPITNSSGWTVKRTRRSRQRIFQSLILSRHSNRHQQFFVSIQLVISFHFVSCKYPLNSILVDLFIQDIHCRHMRTMTCASLFLIKFTEQSKEKINRKPKRKKTRNCWLVFFRSFFFFLFSASV